MSINPDLQVAIEVFERQGFDVSLTVEKAIHKLISSIPHFTKQDGLIHDLSHIFANAVKGQMDEEDFAFIVQTKLSGIHLDHGKEDTAEYRKVREQLQKRAEIISDFFFRVTGNKSIPKLSDKDLKDYPLCMFGIVPDNNPPRIFKGRYPYRLMSQAERSSILNELSNLLSIDVLDSVASHSAPQRVDIHAHI
jgi:hypothetical protein